jgi:hypothetical protein
MSRSARPSECAGTARGSIAQVARCEVALGAELLLNLPRNSRPDVSEGTGRPRLCLGPRFRWQLPPRT